MKTMKYLSLAEVVLLFPASQREGVAALSNNPGADGLVVFENLNRDSTDFGKRTALAVGRGCTHKTIAECKGAWLGEGTDRQDAVACCLIGTKPDLTE